MERLAARVLLAGIMAPLLAIFIVAVWGSRGELAIGVAFCLLLLAVDWCWSRICLTYRR